MSGGCASSSAAARASWETSAPRRALPSGLRLTPVTAELDATGPAHAEDSDVFVGIYWQSYGWTASTGVSGIEEEYVRGGELPQLVYVKEPAPGREPALERLLQRIGEEGRASYRSFAAPGELAELLVDDLAALMSERFYGGRTPVHDLPQGTVSFLFADIDGSTPLVRQLGDTYPDVLDSFRRIVTDATRAHGGAVVDFDGDGVFSAFAAAGAAARAAVDVQRTLAGQSWPEDVVLRARIGVHTGAAQLTPSGYAGLEVHRAARIGAAANGCQILLSRAVADLLSEELGDGLSLVDLGSFALKGLDRAEPLFQLAAAGLERDLPAPRLGARARFTSRRT